MGNSNSILSQEQLEEYVQLTYLTKSEILYILQKFINLHESKPKPIELDLYYRYHVSDVMEEFPALKYNPFRERLFRVFSTLQDERFSFEDFLDLCSTMSINCPLNVKASWAFKIFDFNEDNQITKEDLFIMMDSLTRHSQLKFEEKNHICDILLNEMDLQHTGGMNHLEFLHSITKMPEFATTFSFRL